MIFSCDKTNLRQHWQRLPFLLEETKTMQNEPSAELLSEYTCPVACFQQAISGKYKLRILWDLRNGPLRYGEIKRSLSAGIPSSKEIAPRVLSRELKNLTNLGWVERKEYA